MDAPLRLLLEPGDHQCTWTIPTGDGTSTGVPGGLVLRGGAPPVGSAHGDLPVEWDVVDGPGVHSAGFPQVVGHPVLVGRLVSGLDVLLFHASTDQWLPGSATVDARAAVVGLNLRQLVEGTDAPRFRALTLQVTGLDAMAGVAPLQTFRFPPPDREQPLAGEWTAEGNPDSHQEWIGDGARVDLGYDGTARVGDPYAYGLSFSPVVRVRLDDPLGLDDWVRRWVVPVTRLASLTSRPRESITFLALEQRAEPGQVPLQRRHPGGEAAVPVVAVGGREVDEPGRARAGHRRIRQHVGGVDERAQRLVFLVSDDIGDTSNDTA